MPSLLQSSLVPSVMSHSSGVPLALQSGSHASGTPLLLQSGSQPLLQKNGPPGAVDPTPIWHSSGSPFSSQSKLCALVRSALSALPFKLQLPDRS